MSDIRPDRDDDPIRYPQNRVVGIVDTVEQLASGMGALTGGGFLESEVEVMCGQAAAEKLRASTGRTGLANLAMRLVAAIGLPDDETAMKDRYAEALDEGRFLVSVMAPTEERKSLAASMLQGHGGHFINFMGSSTIERMVRPIVI